MVATRPMLCVFPAVLSLVVMPLGAQAQGIFKCVDGELGGSVPEVIYLGGGAHTHRSASPPARTIGLANDWSPSVTCTEASNRHVRKRIQDEFLVARCAILIAGHAHQHQQE